MGNRSKLLAVKCTLQEYRENTGGIALKWQKQWDAIRLLLIFFGTTMKQKKGNLILQKEIETLLNLSASAKKKVCGCYCAPAHMYVQSGILGDCRVIF